MQSSDLKEDQIIESIAKHFRPPSHITGIGDDCAVIPIQDNLSWLVTTDALIEGIHFLTEEIDPTDLGYKTIAVNVSDITAMGGQPQYAFLTIALSQQISSLWVHSLIAGISEACEKWNVLLLGGDTVGSKRDVFLNLTLLGTTQPNAIKYRSSAQPGDYICVTGYLGDSAGGLKSLQAKLSTNKEIQHLIQAHFRPQPNPEIGKWLAAHSAVHAMMDLSDGLDCDLKRLLKSSQKGAMINVDSIPISEQLSKICQEQLWDPMEFALVGGEDYCLLVTINSDEFSQILEAYQQHFGLSLFRIGAIQSSNNELVYQKDGQVVSINYKNYNHFE